MIVWSRPHLRLLAVADRVDEQLPQRHALECLAEHVEDLATVGLPLLLDLLQQPKEDVPLAGAGRDHVPEMADLLLADPVDAAKPLLDPVRVPRQVVVDHQVGPLQVEALTGRIGGDQDDALGVLAEAGLHGTTLQARDTTMDRGDSLGPAEQRPGLVDEVAQGVAVFGEDDDLAQGAGRLVAHLS